MVCVLVGLMHRIYLIALKFRIAVIVSGYASRHTWCLSQAGINWKDCGRKGIQCKNGGDD